MKRVYTCTITLEEINGRGQIHFKDNSELNEFERIGLFEYLLADWKIARRVPEHVKTETVSTGEAGK
jgi:hypothetical protein